MAQKYAASIQAALTEIGISTNPVAPIANFAFGRELASRFQHVGGLSRSWYIDRLPGTEIEPGWLFMLCPPGLAASPPWHAVPLPAAWIVHYLQRQLVSMPATRLLAGDSGYPDPTLPGGCPTAEAR